MKIGKHFMTRITTYRRIENMIMMNIIITLMIAILMMEDLGKSRS